MQKSFSDLRKLEKENCDSIDRVADTFATLMRDMTRRLIETDDNIDTFCYNLGRLIYLLDAVDDVEKDSKSGEYNPLQRWLEEKIFPFEAQWDENSIYWAGMLAMAEMMACGTTSFTDMYFFDKVAAKVVKESGMKSNFSNPPVGTDGTPLKKMAYFAETFEELQKYCRTKGRFIHEFGLHAEYSSCESLVRETAAFAKENERFLSI